MHLIRKCQLPPDVLHRRRLVRILHSFYTKQMQTSSRLAAILNRLHALHCCNLSNGAHSIADVLNMKIIAQKQPTGGLWAKSIPREASTWTRKLWHKRKGEAIKSCHWWDSWSCTLLVREWTGSVAVIRCSTRQSPFFHVFVRNVCLLVVNDRIQQNTSWSNFSSFPGLNWSLSFWNLA